MLQVLKLKITGENFSPRQLQDKTSQTSSTSEVQLPLLQLQLHHNLPKSRRKLRKKKPPRKNNLKNKKKKLVWEDYLIEHKSLFKSNIIYLYKFNDSH